MNNQITHFWEFPVFQVIGGSTEKRTEWMHWLKGELAKRGLHAALVPPGAPVDLIELFHLIKCNDIVLMDTSGEFAVRTIFLTDGNKKADSESTNLFFTAGAEQHFILELVQSLNDLVKSRPVWACILIGGKSSRMGRPKHLIEDSGGQTWLEHTVATLRPLVDGLVFSGAGAVPQTVVDVQRLPDIPGIAGPLTGILAAMRWQSGVSWLLLACDMPLLSREAVDWLLQGRQAGQWGQVPRVKGKRYCEPLFAWYDIYAAQLFEELVLHGNLRPGSVARHEKVNNPEIPKSLQSAWENVNTPEQLHVVEKGSAADLLGIIKKNVSF